MPMRFDPFRELDRMSQIGGGLPQRTMPWVEAHSTRVSSPSARVVEVMATSGDGHLGGVRHADEDATALVAGVRAVHEQAVATHARLGSPRFDAVGRPFDPILHEAVTTVEADAPLGTMSVVRPGYGTPEAPLRPAGVVVARQ